MTRRGLARKGKGAKLRRVREDRVGRGFDVALTALAPLIWGTTYIVTTQLLPPGVPLHVSLLRALPAGLLLMAFVRVLPSGAWVWRAFLLGALNFTIFWALLFVSAYRLPGGVAATVGAFQPLIVVLLAPLVLGANLRPRALAATAAGVAGVALLILTPAARLDPLGLLAGFGGALSMAFGTLLTRRWGPSVPPLTMTAWQLTAGGLLLIPLALALEPPPPAPTAAHLAGYLWLGLLGAAITYILWFRGLRRLDPTRVAPLSLLSPVTATILGWALLGERLGALQLVGAALTLGAVWASQTGAGRPRGDSVTPSSQPPASDRP